jgi:hypothetical protein
MKLTAKTIPYSSIVGGGLMLCDQTGRARFIVSFRGTTEGISKDETAALSSQFAAFIKERGLEILERP